MYVIQFWANYTCDIKDKYHFSIRSDNYQNPLNTTIGFYENE